ncbi:hypothetical protein MNBD_BACTEROID05-1053 [hydrothermal vent metagenome]|uniref:Polymerase nucleotidyl transferase domain-containing protein n=1 Tax=hydrothermal vent metagenome TaxID=652676 RepID=A0A3B0TXR8_9ZZZZ
MIKIAKNIIPKQKQVVSYLKKHGVVKAGVFGSYARGEQKKRSDIDILVKVERGTSLLDIAGFELDLEDIVQKKIDLLTYGAIHPYVKDIILQDEVPIL